MAALDRVPAAPVSAQRRSMLAKIHVAKKQLAMDEDDYRQILFNVTGHHSLIDCTDEDLHMVVGAMKARGFKPVPKSTGSGRATAMHPMARKARAMWISLHHLGLVRNPSEEALEAFAKRQLGCEKLVWARQGDAHKLIEALKDMGKRAGWRSTDANGKALTPLQLNSHLCEVILGKLKAGAAVPADWTLDIAAWRLCGIDTADTENGFTAEHYQRLAKALGDKLRALAPQEAEA
jgi:phage gp16-like protein